MNFDDTYTATHKIKSLEICGRQYTKLFNDGDTVVVMPILKQIVRERDWNTNMCKAIGLLAKCTDYYAPEYGPGHRRLKFHTNSRFTITEIISLRNFVFPDIALLSIDEYNRASFMWDEEVIITNNIQDVSSFCVGRFINYDPIDKKFIVNLADIREKKKLESFKYCVRKKGNEHLLT